MANSVDPDQICSGSTLFASILNALVMLGNYLQQTTSADFSRRHFQILRIKLLVLFPFLASGKVIDVHTDKSKVSDEPCPDWILNDCIRVCATNGYICRGNMCQCGPFR